MISSGVNTRELILEILLQIEERVSTAILRSGMRFPNISFFRNRNVALLQEYVREPWNTGSILIMSSILFPRFLINKMKPQIREILRSAVYQLKFMDSVPDSAVCNEAVKLAQRKGFYNLKALCQRGAPYDRKRDR